MDALGNSEQVLNRCSVAYTAEVGDNGHMNQLTFGDAEYLGKRTWREVFLAKMEQVVPRDALLALIELVYPKAGRGRRPYR